MPFRLLIVTSYRVFREALADVLDRETVWGAKTQFHLQNRRCGVPKLRSACKSAHS